MSYSQADEYDRRMHAREIEYQRRVDAVVLDPAEQETEYIVECAKSLIVDREMAAEAVVAAAARAEAYAVMSAECHAQIAARRVQEGWEPLDSVTPIDDNEEVAAAPPEPSRPEREPVSMEVDRRLAMYGPRSPFSVLDVEREILLERIEAELAAGLIDDEECPF